MWVVIQSVSCVHSSHKVFDFGDWNQNVVQENSTLHESWATLLLDRMTEKRSTNQFKLNINVFRTNACNNFIHTEFSSCANMFVLTCFLCFTQFVTMFPSHSLTPRTSAKCFLLHVFYLLLCLFVDGGSEDSVTAGSSAPGHAGARLCVCVSVCVRWWW